ncbi:hypothetical protein NLJ89_g9067 [Agrocybe chaxingu]|uniref:Uncharacterized protein n=1 Tax=Agrocybe chaxingu TaxID=84603 RepID=A0A9W8MTW5_9AGAR|nr:hypothetical protein NLJ89_g9067 [Agrocybe chaxingu]
MFHLSLFKKFGKSKKVKKPQGSFNTLDTLQLSPRVVDVREDYGYESDEYSDDEGYDEEWFVEDGEIDEARGRRLEQWTRIEELFWKHGVAKDPWATTVARIEAGESTVRQCWSHIREVGDNLVDYALQLVEENAAVIDDLQLDEVEAIYERLERTREEMRWKSGDTERARLLKARIFLQEASGFARRVLFISDDARTSGYESDNPEEGLFAV